MGHWFCPLNDIYDFAKIVWNDILLLAMYLIIWSSLSIKVLGILGEDDNLFLFMGTSILLGT